jgi:hypothetical protein
MLRRFEPGNSHGGRPRGARNKLSRKFLEDLIKDWEENGAGAIKLMRMEDPAAYCRMFASLIPRELTIETSAADLSDEELDAMIQKLRAETLEAMMPEPLLIDARPDERQRYAAPGSEQTQRDACGAEGRAQ